MIINLKGKIGKNNYFTGISPNGYLVGIPMEEIISPNFKNKTFSIRIDFTKDLAVAEAAIRYWKNLNKKGIEDD